MIRFLTLDRSILARWFFTRIGLQRQLHLHLSSERRRDQIQSSWTVYGKLLKINNNQVDSCPYFTSQR